MSHNGPQPLSLPPQCEDQYVHLNVCMLEHLQRRRLDLAFATARQILALYVGADVPPLAEPPVTSSAATETAKAVALAPAKARLELIQRLPPDVPAREVLRLELQASMARFDGDAEAESEDASSETTTSAESSDDEEDDDASGSGTSTATTSGRNSPVPPTITTSSSSTRGQPSGHNEVTVSGALARIVARLPARAPPDEHEAVRSVNTSQGTAPRVDADTAIPQAADEPAVDEEIDAQEAAWVAAAEADIEKEMQRLAIARKHR